MIAASTAHAEDSPWLPIRDQNPFVLGSGLPLLPQRTLEAGQWGVEATLSESNSRLESPRTDLPTGQVIFGAETRETRVAVSYAIDDAWTARASIGDEWIGVGFLDKPIKRFHKLIGSPRGYRDGHLGFRPPYIRVISDGKVEYLLDEPGQAVTPLLLDVTRRWTVSETTYGLSFATKLPTGDTQRLSDAGDHAVSVSGFGEFTVLDDAQLGVRAGYMHTNGNEVLPAFAKSSAAFGDVAVRAPISDKWSWVLQYDIHGALYRRLPEFLADAGDLTIGLARQVGDHSELLFGVTEDVPMAHTQDVSLMVGYRYR
jgi:hypothetical protein